MKCTFFYKDILELFEMTILTSFDNEAEMDETIFADYLFDFSNLYKLANHYADDYVAIVGQLFLDDCIDFWRCVYHKMDNANTKTPNLSQYKKENKYETWKYFRDNYIYSYNDNLVNHATKGDFWGIWIIGMCIISIAFALKKAQNILMKS
ncbi:hypothetical protein O8S82_001794 [Campylobacter coli]|nr:hypothetical protein [Campylobacter coli]